MGHTSLVRPLLLEVDTSNSRRQQFRAQACHPDVRDGVGVGEGVVAVCVTARTTGWGGGGGGMLCQIPMCAGAVGRSGGDRGAAWPHRGRPR